MAMNAITAQLDLARTLEELASRSDGKIPTVSSDQSFQIETSDSKQFDPEQTEITACVSRIPAVNEISLPSIDVVKLRRHGQEAVDVNDLLKEYTDPRGRRSSERFNFRVSVIIYSAKRSFRTVTTNISLGGVRLRDSIPANFCTGEIEVVFIVQNKHNDTKEYFLMSAKPVTRDRVQFTTASSNAKLALRSLIKILSEKKTA